MGCGTRGGREGDHIAVAHHRAFVLLYQFPYHAKRGFPHVVILFWLMIQLRLRDEALVVERLHRIAVGGLRPIRWIQPYDQDPTWGVLDLMERELLAKVPDELDL
jgi:hypothetical protein